MALNIVLVHPQIPQNTGNIARLTAATGCELHLIEPLGFELTDRYLKRAGLDYWSEVSLSVHQDWETFLSGTEAKEDRMWFLTKKADESYYQIEFRDGDYLIFGSETTGLPAELHQRFSTQRRRIPMDNPRVRSLNLSNSVAVVLYEARRQLAVKVEA